MALWSPPGDRVPRPDDRTGGHRLWTATPCGADPRAVRVSDRAPEAPDIGPHPIHWSKDCRPPLTAMNTRGETNRLWVHRGGCTICPRGRTAQGASPRAFRVPLVIRRCSGKLDRPLEEMTI